jgi:hypothetical protein
LDGWNRPREKSPSNSLSITITGVTQDEPTNNAGTEFALKTSPTIAVLFRLPYHHFFRRGLRLAITFSRHARRQMKWRRVSEADVVSVIEAPDRVEQSGDERINAHKLLGDRLLKATYVEEEGNIVVITVIEKASV